MRRFQTGRPSPIPPYGVCRRAGSPAVHPNPQSRARRVFPKCVSFHRQCKMRQVQIMSRVEKPRVLLADDNEATCTLITALLYRDFEVEVAIDGREAIEYLRTRKYAALLLDLRMPHTDGFAVLDFLKEHQPKMLASV